MSTTRHSCPTPVPRFVITYRSIHKRTRRDAVGQEVSKAFPAGVSLPSPGLLTKADPERRWTPRFNPSEGASVTLTVSEMSDTGER
jgi:hypothetical protein